MVCSRLLVALAVAVALEVALDTESVEGPLVSITIEPTTCSIIILVLDLGMGFLLPDLEVTQQTKTKDMYKTTGKDKRQETKEKYERQQTKEKGRRLLGGLRTLEDDRRQGRGALL